MFLEHAFTINDLDIKLKEGVKYAIGGEDKVLHTKLLSSLMEQIEIPETDVVPICSNCHRMIHRGRNNVLSIEALK